jgi:hypothetical protein
MLEASVLFTVTPEGTLTMDQETLNALPPGIPMLAEDGGHLLGMTAAAEPGKIAIVSRAGIEAFLTSSRSQCDAADQAFLDRARQNDEEAKQAATALSGQPKVETTEGGLICWLPDGHRILAADVNKDGRPDFCTHSAHLGLIRLIPSDVAQLSGEPLSQALQRLWSGI